MTVAAAWTNLADSGCALTSSLIGQGGDTNALAGQSLDHLRELIGSTEFARTQAAILVDSDWRVLACNAGSERSGSCPSVAETVAWQTAAEDAPRIRNGVPGRVTFGDNEYVGIAFAVEDGAGKVVVHRSAEEAEQLSASVGAALPLAGLLAGVWTCAMLGITIYLITSRQHEQIESERSESDANSLRHIQTLVRTRDAVIFGLAKLADSRDPETGDHLERIAVYSSTLASALRAHPKYASTLTPTFVRLIGISSALHDIGKVGIADSILLKPGRLTPEERKQMQLHTLIGGECLRQIEYRLGQSNFLQMAREIALAHHERWDGKGYPNGLAGQGIPLSARIVSIADVYDALSSKRVYKEPIPHGECVDIIRAGAGTQFDAELVEIWLKISDQFRDLAQRYRPRDAAGEAQDQDAETRMREEEMSPA